MGKLKISFQPLFIIYVIICLYFGWTNIIFNYVLVITLHEFAHFYIAGKLGYQIKSMIFSVSGVGIYGDFVFREKDDILISIAGPIINLIAIVVAVCFWWIVPTSYLFTYDFVICNLSVMIFNLLPIYPLDGGRVFMSILSLKNKDKNKVKRVSLLVSFIFGLFLLILFCVSIFIKTNYNLLIIGMFMTINAISHDNNKYYSKAIALNKSCEKPIEIKEFYVKAFNKIDLIKRISPHYYSVFIVKQGDKNIRIEECDLLK